MKTIAMNYLSVNLNQLFTALRRIRRVKVNYRRDSSMVKVSRIALLNDFS